MCSAPTFPLLLSPYFSSTRRLPFLHSHHSIQYPKMDPQQNSNKDQDFIASIDLNSDENPKKSVTFSKDEDFIASIDLNSDENAFKPKKSVTFSKDEDFIASIDLNSDEHGFEPKKSVAFTKDEDFIASIDLNSDENGFKPKKSVTFSKDLISESPSPPQCRPSPSSAPPINYSPAEFKSKVESVKGALTRWSKRVGEATRKAEDLAGNTWQHCPSFTDAALGRIVRSTKVLAEGGYDKIFHQTFETDTEEKLQDSFACYLSTSVGPVMGVLYVSTEKLAYCSDNPLSYKDDDITQWSYYKVTIPLDELKSVNPSSNISNSSEKYIQVISVDNQEFWFMGFLYYSAALDLLKEVLEVRSLQPA